MLRGTTALVLLAGSALAFAPKSNAAGVVLSASSTELANGGAADVTFSWTASNANAVEISGTTYTFTADPAFGSAMANCNTADVQADVTSGGAGTFGGFSTTNATFTTSSATTTTGRALCIKLPSVATPGSYSIAMTSSTGDISAVLIHFGDIRCVVTRF